MATFKNPLDLANSIQDNEQVFYHGTNADFDEFDIEKANPESSLGRGFYFDTLEPQPNDFKNIKKVALTYNHPSDMNNQQVPEEKWDELINKLGLEKPSYYDNDYKVINRLANQVVRNGGRLKDFYNTVRDITGVDSIFRELPNGRKIVVVYNSDQIKQL